MWDVVDELVEEVEVRVERSIVDCEGEDVVELGMFLWIVVVEGVEWLLGDGEWGLDGLGELGGVVELEEGMIGDGEFVE